MGEDLAALGAEGVGVVEDLGDAALLGEGWSGISSPCKKPVGTRF